MVCNKITIAYEDIMTTKLNQSIAVGDVFLIPLRDGTFSMGQVVGFEPLVLNSVSCAFFAIRSHSDENVDAVELSSDRLYSIQFVTRDLLLKGKWRIIRNENPSVKTSELPYESLRNIGFVGAKVIGSGIMEQFANAYFALSPWDDWHDPQYLDKLLRSAHLRPNSLIYIKSN